MSFVDIEFVARGSEPPAAKLSYLRPKKRDGSHKPGAKPELRISIPTTVCGTAKAKRYLLQVGSGENAGKIRVAGTAKAAGIEPHEMKHAFVFKFGYVPQLGEDIFDDERHAVRKIDDSTFEVDAGALFAVTASDGGAPAPASSKPAKR